ncbi:MAG: hypothetical protein JWM41_616 [Gemmatimonadetes bacterium]|nr:hypothetical protein [Gemmatimonadota bacterium]
MRKWYPMALFVVAAAASIYAYPRLPDRVPTHWGVHGQIDGYGSKWMTLILMPLMVLGLWGLFRVLPTIDPRRENYARFADAYDLIVNSVLSLLVAMHLLIIAATLGVPINVSRVAVIAVGLLLIVIGNVLPRARPTWFVGIRTPWTLSNDRVWERTHRVGGYLMVIAGVLAVCFAFAPPEVAGPAVGVLGAAAALGSVVYSYVAWKQETSR